MKFSISRGTVRHTLVENILDLIRSTFFASSYLRAASCDEKAALDQALQKKFQNTQVAFYPFARTCLHVILSNLNIPKGSRILMTPITIGPMVEVIESLGFEVVFVDIETDTFGPCLKSLQEKLDAGAYCFLLTYLFGFVPDVREAVRMCRNAGTFVIEDISHNLGASSGGRLLGMWGEASIYSASLLKYVDGYNGAFTITNIPSLASALKHGSSTLSQPDSQRVRNVVLKTLIWNFALKRWIFSFATWPALRLLKLSSPTMFENLLGPGIPFHRSPNLPSFYFEQLTKLQAQTMLRNLSKLPKRLERRREVARRAIDALMQTCDCSARVDKNLHHSYSFSTYWQFVVPVRSTEESRSILFENGIETNTTNLRDLASDLGVILPGARTLKEKCIFVPLHDYLKDQDYLKIFNILLDARQLDCERAKKMYQFHVEDVVQS